MTARDEYEKIVEETEAAAPDMVARVMAMDNEALMDVLQEHLKQSARYLARRDRPRALLVLFETMEEIAQAEDVDLLSHKSD